MFESLTLREILLCVPFLLLAVAAAIAIDGGPIADVGLTLVAGIAAGGAIAVSRKRRGPG